MMRFTGAMRAARFASATRTQPFQPFQPYRFFSGVTEFRKAMAAINSEEHERDVSNKTKLHMYGLFKQAETGPCATPQPGFFDPVGRAKHESWSKLGNMSKEVAMGEYVKLVADLFEGVIPDVAQAASASASASTSTSTSASAPAKKVSVAAVAFPAKEERQTLSQQDLKTITIQSDAGSYVAHVALSRPKRGNAFNMQMWDEYTQVRL
jgi:acyl-CoA-binding protein